MPGAGLLHSSSLNPEGLQRYIDFHRAIVLEASSRDRKDDHVKTALPFKPRSRHNQSRYFICRIVGPEEVTI